MRAERTQNSFTLVSWNVNRTNQVGLDQMFDMMSDSHNCDFFFTAGTAC